MALEPLGAEAVLLNLDRFLAGVDKMSSAMDRYGDEAARAGQKADKSQAGMMAFASSVGNFVGGAALAATGALINLGQAGFGQLTDFIGDSITASNEAAAVQAQLNATLESTGGAAGISADQINTLASAMQDLTRFDDESIASADTVLLRFNKIGGESFPRVTQAVLDMAQAMGTTAPDAALKIGRALQDPEKGLVGLTRAGVQFSEGQKEVIAKLVETGRSAEAQDMILKQLEARFGGSAAAAATTLGGKLDQLGNKFNDLQEKVGNAIDPIARMLVDRLTGAVDQASDKLDELADDGSMTVWSARTAAAIVVVLDGLGSLVGGFATAFTLIAQIVATVGKTIYTLLQWINPFARHSPSLVDQVEIGVDQIIESYSRIREIEGTLDSAGDALTRLGDAARTAGKDDLKVLEGAAGDAKRVIDDLNRSIDDAERKISDLSRTQIEGEQATNDAAFALEQQRKQAELNVAQLKKSGASKEQIKAAEDQVDAISNDLRILQLQTELTFDPLHRQIDALAEPVSELPFQTIIEGIKGAQDEIATAKSKLGPAEEAYKTLATAVDQYKNKIAELAGGGGGGGGGIGGGIGALDDIFGNLPEIKSPIDDEEWTRTFEAAKTEYEANIKPMFADLNRNLDQLNKDLDNASKEAEKWSKLFSEYIVAPTTKLQELIEKVPLLDAAFKLPMFNPFAAILDTLQKISTLIDLINGKRVNPVNPVTSDAGGGGGAQNPRPSAPNPVAPGPQLPGDTGGNTTSARTTEPLSAQTALRPAAWGGGGAMGGGGPNIQVGPNYVRSNEDVHSVAYNVRRYSPAPAR